MRNFISNAAAGTAMLAAAVSADLCSQGSANILGNFYCQAVDTIQYQNFAAKGSYNRVTHMDPASGACSSEPFGTSGSLSPLNQDVSFHIRGPLDLKQFAHYVPGSSAAKRSHQKRHGHGHFHAHEARDNNSNEEKRDVGDWVVQTMDGKVVSWINQYGGAAAPTAAAGAVTSAVGGAAAAATGAAGPLPKPFTPSYNGDWVRAAHYAASEGKSEGVAFLNNFGGQGSGTFDYSFGNSLSYASSDGKSGSGSPQVLADKTLPSNTEVILMSDKPCSAGSGCGYSRPGTVAHHGFENENAVYLLEFAMPDDGSSEGLNPNMPAIWMLNAQIPRTLQYGDSKCSCWSSGCGEFDICEVLDQGNPRCKSTLHGLVSGGDSDYFDRPTSGPIKMAVVMSDSMATIKVLPSDFDFSKTLTNEDISKLGQHSSGGFLENLGSSLFDLAQMGTSGDISPY